MLEEIEKARQTADENYGTINKLLSSVNEISTYLSSSIQEMTATTMSLAENAQHQTTMEEEIINASGKNVQSIDELTSNANTQSVVFKILSEGVNELSNSINELNNETAKSVELTKSISDRISEGEKAIESTSAAMVAIDYKLNMKWPT